MILAMHELIWSNYEYSDLVVLSLRIAKAARNHSEPERATALWKTLESMQ